MIYLNEFIIPDENEEADFLYEIKRTCYNTFYPFGIFPKLKLEKMKFAPITILYGGNGTGKSTLLNIIAEKLKLRRVSVFNKSSFYNDYIELCQSVINKNIPDTSRIITSDDVFDYVLDIRKLNESIDFKREDLFEEYIENKYTDFHFQTMEDIDRLKAVNKTRSKSQSKYVKDKLNDNVREYSNGESAFKYFTEKIAENALYLLDEPENSLAPNRQIELAQYIEDSARFYGCQFIISTHSPFLLSINQAKIYNLDKTPVTISKWIELENVRTYFDFFEKHRDEFYT